MIRTATFLALSVVCATSALAENKTCVTDAAAKKLTGAAMTSFMTKCQNDAKAKCDKSAAEKKLTGAAKTSFEKKCNEDAVGKT